MTTVLIVEDEAIVAEDLAGKLRGLGHEVAGIAMEGEEAIALVESLRPHLVLMDIWLAGTIDGIEAAEAIRNRFDVPVIYLTAHSDSATLARAKTTGPFGYILKPFEERDLATQIELALYKHQADREIREQREWLRVTLTSIGDAVIATDAEGRITFVNPVAETLTGWKGEEAMGRPLSTVFRIVNEQTGQALEDPVGRVLREGHPVPLANHAALVTRDGRTVPIEDSAAPILDAGGKVLGAVLVFHDVTEKRRAEEALREANERYELVLAGSGAAIWDWEVPRHKVMYSQRWKAMRGFAEHEITDSESEWSWGIHPDDNPRVMAAVQAHFEGKTEYFDEDYRVCRKDGSWMWIADRGVARRDADGRVVRMAGSEVDITERKQAEKELRAAEELAQQRLVEIEDIYHNAPVGMCVLDRDLRFVRINERLAEINGIPAAEHIGKTVRDLLPELADTVEPEMRRILETGEPRLNIEIASETPAQSGVKRSWMEQWLPIIDAHGQVAGLNVVVEETTERMRLLGEIERTRDELEARVIMRTAELAQTNAELQQTARALVGSEEKLRRNIELLQKVFDGITDPLIMLDGSGLVTMINRAAVSYYGVDETKDIYDKPCFEALRGRETACPECPYPFPSVGASALNFQRNGLNDPGTVESITVYPVIKEQGGRDAVIVRISDITKAKILEKQILQNEKLAALGLMTSGIAHEINNPNSFIYFNLPILRSYLEELMPIVDEHAAQHPDFEVLNMPYGDLREDIFRLLENMEHGSQRISKTIGVLKSFVRGRDQEGVQRFDLKELIEKVVALCRTDLRQKLGSFEIMVPDNLPTIVSDPEAIEQVLMNLLINAIQACDKPDSHVSLKVRHDVSGVGGFVMEITDNGPGIEGTVRERIFDPFFTTKPPNQGTGLGLYICHSHVTSLGGRIEVESKVGEGTTFRVVLPVNFRHVMEGALQDQA